MIQEIHDFLTGGILDFNEGFALFCKYSRNESLMSWIGRKKDMDRLIYNLRKLNGFTDLKVNPRHADMLIRYNKAPDAVVIAKPDTPAGQQAENGKIIFRTYDERRTRRGDLPEELQKVYDEIADDYKLRKAYHEKMKIAKTDDERAKFRENLMETEDRIRKGWSSIDSYLLARSQTAVNTEFKETTIRSYISKKLKKESLTPADIEQLRIRVKALQDNNCTFTEAVAEKLRALGLF